ncbi:MAG: hypothetical protein B7733_07565 [Myxococcales bacterium FL481]|nr:MAG: hypothetical protein B7733_07565 [Myxococcales bacterium FL481]
MLAPIGLQLCLFQVASAATSSPAPATDSAGAAPTSASTTQNDETTAPDPEPASEPANAAATVDAGGDEAPAKLNPETGPESSAPSLEPGSLVVGPGVDGRFSIVDANGTVVATVDARPADATELRLPPGKYRLLDATGQTVAPVDVVAGDVTNYTQTSPATSAPMTPSDAADETIVSSEPSARDESGPAPAPRWRRIASPLMAATVPGLGHMVNRRGGRGTGILLSSIGLGVGAAALYAAGTREADALLGSKPSSFAADAVRLGALGLLTGSLQMLYAAQIMDAAAITRGGRVRPRRDYKLSLELTRMATVGMNARDAEASLYTDWGLSLMGQAFERFSVGISDVSVKTNWRARRSTLQAGGRAGYRFYDQDRLWLGGAIGALVQASFRDIPPSDYATDDEWRAERAVTAAPYAQFEARWFLLNRWSLHLAPRVTLPLGTRYYTGARAIANQSLTFEIGSGLGVQF